MSACAYCQSEVPDQIICPRCQRVTASHLADVPEHVAELTTVMTKDTVYSERSDGGKSADPTIAWAGIGNRFLSDVAAEIEKNPIATPYAKSAAALLRELRATLVSWTRLLNEEQHIPLPDDTVEALAEHLRRNMSLLANHQAAGEFVREVSTLVPRITECIDAPKNRTTFLIPKPYNKCPERLPAGDLCGGDLLATVPANEDIRPTVKCQHCRQEWFSDQWTRMGHRIQQMLDHGTDRAA